MMIMTGASAIDVPAKVYMFGFAASFNDSIIYMTEIQEVDSAWISQKGKLLAEREVYSFQLKNFLERTYKAKNETCVTFFALKKKDCEKKFLKMKKMYAGDPTAKKKKKKKDTEEKYYNITYISADNFRYEAVKSMDIEEKKLTKEEKQQLKEEARKKKEQSKGKGPKGGPGGGQGGPGGGRPDGM